MKMVKKNIKKKSKQIKKSGKDFNPFAKIGKHPQQTDETVFLEMPKDYNTQLKNVKVIMENPHIEFETEMTTPGKLSDIIDQLSRPKGLFGM